jgi:hypothetical protein
MVLPLALLATDDVLVHQGQRRRRQMQGRSCCHRRRRTCNTGRTSILLVPVPEMRKQYHGRRFTEANDIIVNTAVEL